MKEKNLRFKQQFVDLLLEDIKTSTIRTRTDLEPGDIFWVRDEDKNKRRFIVKEVNPITYGTITDEIAYAEGYRHRNLLKAEIKAIYRKVQDDDKMYQIKFERMNE